MTELVFILDRSGSMHGSEADTIGGFNAMLEKQRGGEGEVLVSTVLFNGVCKVLHDRLPLERVPALTEQDYTVGGSTALLDAVGGAIHHIGNVHKYARPEDRPTKTLFIITTDGMENSSRRYSYARVREMIRHEEEKYGWEFIFLGADIDVAAESGRLGIRCDRSMRYQKKAGGIDRTYDMLSDVVSAARVDDPFDNILHIFKNDQRNK